jgi:hypothetical protein
MRRLFRMGLRRNMLIMQAAACLAGLATLLTFPALRPHQFLEHFRAPDVRCEIGRHPFVDHSKNNLTEEIVASYREPGIVPLLDSRERTLPVVHGESDAVVVPARLSLHLKLGPPGRAPADPLL